jgi:hypothetical protein
MLQRPHVVPHFLHIISSLRLAEEWGLGLEGEEVDQGGSGALYARGEDRLASEEGTDEQVRVLGRVRPRPRQFAQSPVGLRERGDEGRPVRELRW